MKGRRSVFTYILPGPRGMPAAHDRGIEGAWTRMKKRAVAYVTIISLLGKE